MDYFTKKILFHKLGFLELEFEGDCGDFFTCVILVLEVKRLLHKGCEAYLAHVFDTSTLEVTLGSVLVVQKFSDVFSEDFSRLPLDRELEFCIDLMPKIASISIPLYRMAPTEIKELKILS